MTQKFVTDDTFHWKSLLEGKKIQFMRDPHAYQVLYIISCSGLEVSVSVYSVTVRFISAT
jgi:hypothetical protein